LSSCNSRREIWRQRESDLPSRARSLQDGPPGGGSAILNRRITVGAVAENIVFRTPAAMPSRGQRPRLQRFSEESPAPAELAQQDDENRWRGPATAGLRHPIYFNRIRLFSGECGYKKVLSLGAANIVRRDTLQSNIPVKNFGFVGLGSEQLINGIGYHY
jgi:hypothetical protein